MEGMKVLYMISFLGLDLKKKLTEVEAKSLVSRLGQDTGLTAQRLMDMVNSKTASEDTLPDEVIFFSTWKKIFF